MTENKEKKKESNIFELVEKNLGRVLSPIKIECINKWDYENDILPEILEEDDILRFKVTRLYAKWVEEYV